MNINIINENEIEKKILLNRKYKKMLIKDVGLRSLSDVR